LNEWEPRGIFPAALFNCLVGQGRGPAQILSIVDQKA
jgi:hypothetical protein